MWASIAAAVLIVGGVAYFWAVYLPEKRAQEAAIQASSKLEKIRADILLYREQNGRVPGSLSEVTSESADRYTYVVSADAQTFELCTRDSVPKGKKQCYSE